MKLKFHKSWTFVPAAYDAIIPGSNGYRVGISHVSNPLKSTNWIAFILNKNLKSRGESYSLQRSTKRELISYLNLHPEQLHDAALKLNKLEKGERA